jgi:hypothetical protein
MKDQRSGGIVKRSRTIGGRGRTKALAVAVGAAVALPALGAAPATAAAPDPQTTNVPYLAWRGEEMKLVKCDPSLAGATGGEAFVESWSGGSILPRIEDSTGRFFTSSDGSYCVRVDVTSLDGGLARIKFVASAEDGTPVLKHQFLAIWMSLGTPTIDEVGAADPTGGPVGSRSEVGDPAGDGQFDAGARNGRVQATVAGSFPYAGKTWTLPTDWATLAQTVSSDTAAPTTEPSESAWRWDIHDDTTKAEGHVGGFCTTGPYSPVDAVDNCNGDGYYSRVFGDGIPALGPFDPQRPGQTLLSDGKLDAGDAPMPAARIDFTIAANSGAKGDISGVGALAPASKREVYSRNGNGDPSPHNLYAPFYSQYIPATSAPSDRASGVDGPSAGNNFDGFLVDGLYDNWDIAAPLRTAIPYDTHCNQFVAFRGGYDYDVPRTTPRGRQSVAVYSDEHGEAQVEFNPTTGFYFDAVGGILNDNRGCDLQGVDVLGTAGITARAVYPYQPVDDSSKLSGGVTKTVHNLFDKSLSYYPKGAGAENANARILVAHGNEIDGSPLAGERVCFYVGDRADGDRVFQGTTGPAGQRFTVDGRSNPALRDYTGADQCATLDRYGNAAIEVFNSDPESINVIAEYVDEGVLRSIDLDFGTPGSTGGTPPPPPGMKPDGPSDGPGSKAPTAKQIAATAGSKSQLLGYVKKAGKKLAGKTRIRSARILRKSGKYFLVVRVDSAKAKTAKVKVKLISKKGKTISRHWYRIRTNRAVKVVRVSKTVTAKVALKK